jgi:hypothetical protein
MVITLKNKKNFQRKFFVLKKSHLDFSNKKNSNEKFLGLKKLSMNFSNKKAWLRIVEAVIAILIIAGAVLYFTINQTKKTDISGIVFERQTKILEVISKNESLRNSVITENKTEVESYISRVIPSSWNFSINICELDDICNRGATPNDRDIYVSERMITSTLINYSPKKIRFFVWME